MRRPHVIDGYDLIVYGTVVPTLAEGSAEWKLGAAEIGRIVRTR
ncbi:hypothetical protein [Nonomuraea sp. 10N515B]